MTASWITSNCPSASEKHRTSATDRQAQLAKPAGALGRLETVAITLAALQSTDRPCAERAPVLVFAGDHGIVARGVSAYPSEVTAQMVQNFTGGGAAIAVLCRRLRLPLTIVDAGTLSAEKLPGAVTDKPCCGTRDFCEHPAMTDAELDHALSCGRRAVDRLAGESPDVLILGEMGIGNTTSATALVAVLTGRDPLSLAGPGTGLNGEAVTHKAEVITVASTLHRRHVDSALLPAYEALRRVGGLEIAALAGAIISAVQRRIPVLVDGFVVSAAALAAVRMNPACRPWLLFSHRSAEPGHQAILDCLQGQELLQLDLRLGEGSGAAIALPLLQMACALHNEMATFAEAAVSRRR